MMNDRMHSRGRAVLSITLIVAALLTACGGERSPSPEERQAAAAATVAAARATEIAAAERAAQLTREAIPTSAAVPTNTPTPAPSATTTEGVTVSKEIVAAEGGTIELSDGTRIEIPPGALKQDGTVTVTRLDALPQEAGDFSGLSYKAYDIKAPTHTLEVSATITFSYEDLPMDDALAQDAVFAAYWSGTDWQVMEGMVIPETQTLTFSADHFSPFSLFSLPSPSEFGKRLDKFLGERLGIGAPPDTRGWLDIVNAIKPPPGDSWEVRTYRLTSSPFVAIPHFAGDYIILTDPTWYDAQPLVQDMPHAKRDLLAAAFLGHEMAHHIQGDTDFVKSLSESLSQIPQNFTNALAPFPKLWIALTQANWEPFFAAIQEYGQMSLASQIYKESRADGSGFRWAKEASEKWFEGSVDGSDVGIETILTVAHFFAQLPPNPEDTEHPVPKARADQLRNLLPSGIGGLYGEVSTAGKAPEKVRITYEKTGVWTITDAEGRYFLAPIPNGDVALVMSSAGCQKQVIPASVLEGDLRKLDLQFNCVPLGTATPKPTAGMTPIPTRRPGLITDFENWGTWRRGDQAWGTFTRSQEQVAGGSYSGRFTYNFPAVADNFLVYRQTIAIAGQPAALKIMVHGDGSGNYLNAWVQDANGQIWQFTFGQISHTGWQQMSAVLDVNRGWPNQAIGGIPTTAAPVYPLRFSGLVLDGYREDTPLQGVVYVDDLLAGAADGLTPIPVITSTPTAGPTASADIVFRADRTSISAGECANLRWDVDNVTAVYLDGQGVGGHESRQVCPTATQTFNLTVSRQDGSQQQASVTIQVAGGGVTPTSAPTTIPPAGPCEAIPGESYDAINIQGSPSDRPAESHADLNLALRGYEGTSAALQFSDYGPAVDPNGPQLPGLFGDQRTPGFTSAYQVFDWDWGCNCRAGLLNRWDTTLLGMAVSPGETIRVPDSGRSIGSGYEVLVLYATPDRITLKYTPEDNVVSGYTLHVEDVCVEPNLLGLYQSLNQAGRGRLPALRAGQAFGRAIGGEIKVAVRDGGAFFDPRSRQDWWRGR